VLAAEPLSEFSVESWFGDTMTSKPTRLLALALAALLALSACSDGATTDTDAATAAADDTNPGDTTDDTDTTDNNTEAAGAEAGGDGEISGVAIAVADLDPDVATLVTNVGIGYEQVDGVWNGFVPNDHPAVIVIKDGADQVTGAVAFNHPDADALGTATPVDTAGLAMRSVHLVTDPIDADTMDALEGFDFHAELGGVDSFAMVASATDDFFDLTTKDYVSTLLHEMFHRYQDKAFQQMVGQDVEGYAYTAENLELAVLEERALQEAITATDDGARDEAASRFAALRQARLAADPRVELDNSQEMIEGTARYIEHRIGDDAASGYLMNVTNYDADLVTNFVPGSGVKQTFGFGRWYASGAAVLRLLDLMEAEDVAGRVEAGTSPAEILAAELDITEANRDDLVAQARANYDPLGELSDQAAEAAEAAASEPPVFGDETTSGGETGVIESDDGPLTDEQIDCLIEQGVDLEDEQATITDEQWNACFA